MSDDNDLFFSDVTRHLVSPDLLNAVMHKCSHSPMPSNAVLREIVEDVRSVIFPGYFGHADMTRQSLEYYTGSLVEKIYHAFSKQIKRGFCFACDESTEHSCSDCEALSHEISRKLVGSLPRLRELLDLDAVAAFEGDPAARSVGEVIFCYPSIRAMTCQRLAHELFLLDVPIIPRMITELAHSETGIDIHPGATIGEKFFIDHGTGVVIGETTVIGRNVRLYQGVTLGAKSFPLDENGNPIKGIPRHPIVEDDVVVYSGATILGRITIGKGSMIGGNLWITTDVPPNSKVLQGRRNNE
ncbi:MAG TPA: serine O-acetyltransferase EpsC [Spirochaetota bacterium]